MRSNTRHSGVYSKSATPVNLTLTSSPVESLGRTIMASLTFCPGRKMGIFSKRPQTQTGLGNWPQRALNRPFWMPAAEASPPTCWKLSWTASAWSCGLMDKMQSPAGAEGGGTLQLGSLGAGVSMGEGDRESIDGVRWKHLPLGRRRWKAGLPHWVVVQRGRKGRDGRRCLPMLGAALPGSGKVPTPMGLLTEVSHQLVRSDHFLLGRQLHLGEGKN